MLCQQATMLRVLQMSNLVIRWLSSVMVQWGNVPSLLQNAGASQIIMMSRHADRQQMALESGATAVVAERGEEGIAKVREILGGGADAALECVGTEASIDQALGVLHNGGRIGFVGVPHYNNHALGSTFAQNIIIGGGSASVTTYDKEILLDAVLKGDINPGRVFTQTYSLDNIDQAYKDMANRKTIKAMITVD